MMMPLEGVVIEPILLVVVLSDGQLTTAAGTAFATVTAITGWLAKQLTAANRRSEKCERGWRADLHLWLQESSAITRQASVLRVAVH